MFDSLTNRSGPGGTLPALRQPQRPRLERLEERDVPAMIAGVVYADANGNGVQDAGEVGLPNSTIQLFNANNLLIATTVTDSTGQYAFTQNGGPAPAPTEQAFEATFDQTRTNTARNGTLPKFDPSLGQLISVELIAQGTINSNAVVENLDPTAANLSADLNGSIRYTVNGASLQASPTRTIQASLGAFDGGADLQGASAHDFGVTQLNGSFQTVLLTGASDLAAFTGSGGVDVSQVANVESGARGTGNLLAMIRSTVEGKVRVVYHYQPSNTLGPGNYKVVQAAQPLGFLDGQETKGGVTPIAGSHRSDFIQVGIVNRTDEARNNSFGEIRPSAVSGAVYQDVNRSQTLTPGDRGLAGVKVTLVGTTIFGDRLNLPIWTDAVGFFKYNNIVAGDYVLQETQPAGYQQGWNTLGTQGGTVRGDTFGLRPEQATYAANYNFGEVVPTPVTPPNSAARRPDRPFWPGLRQGVLLLQHEHRVLLVNPRSRVPRAARPTRRSGTPYPAHQCFGMVAAAQPGRVPQVHRELRPRGSDPG
ncbi:MAG: choice-of-anchor E domain-containing protein [Gemmataceae bacterium]